MSRRCGRRADGSSGSGTVWVVAAAAVLLVAGGGAVAVAAVLVHHARAVTAADLAALAAAAELQAGGPAADACAAAATVAGRNRARLLSCQVTGEVVGVRVAVHAGTLLSRRHTATADARAGPA